MSNSVLMMNVTVIQNYSLKYFLKCTFKLCRRLFSFKGVKYMSEVNICQNEKEKCYFEQKKNVFLFFFTFWKKVL